jgi:ribosomal subunit interface protein
LESPPQVQVRDVILEPQIERYVNERIAKLEDFYDRIISCRVVLVGPPAHRRKGGPFEVDIDVGVPGSFLVVNRQSHPDIRVAITQAFSAMERQLEDYARKQRGDVKSEAKPPRGRVVRLFPEDGYGFLQADDGREVYFHRNSVLPPGFEELEVGAEVRFAEEDGDEGPQASSVALAGH